MSKNYLLICLLLIQVFGILPVCAQQSLAPKVKELLGGIRKLHGPDAIEEQALVSIGGIPQWISVRGRNKNNPILLFLHGGPGFTASPVSYYYMRDWEEFFTVVHWDQRGAGKTYLANDPEQVKPSLNLDRLVLDAEAVVAHLRKRYKKEKIVLMGHSFGSILGVRLAQKRPEWLHAYIGMGQFIEFTRSEKFGYDQTLARARQDNNAEAVQELLSIAPFPDSEQPERNIQNLGRERRWLATYGGYYWQSKFGSFNEIASMSPDYSEEELRLRNEAQAYSGGILWDELAKVDFTSVKKFKCPVVILQGRHDLGTASFLVEEWFATIKAPSKKIVWFEDAAHMVYEEAPGQTLMTLVNDVLPMVR